MAQANTAAKSFNNLTMDKKILGKDNYLRAYTSNVCDMSMPIELGISDQTVPTMNVILSPIRMKNPKLRPKSNAVIIPSYATRNTSTALITLRGSKFEAAAIASLNKTIQLQLKLSLQKGWIRKLGIEKKVVNFFMNKASKKKQLEMQTEREEKEAARPRPSLNKTFNKDKTSNKITTARRRLDTTFSVMKSSQGRGQGVRTKTELNKTFLVASNSSNIGSGSTAQPLNTKNQTNTNKLPLRPSSVSVVSVTASSASMGYNIR